MKNGQPNGKQPPTSKGRQWPDFSCFSYNFLPFLTFIAPQTGDHFPFSCQSFPISGFEDCFPVHAGPNRLPPSTLVAVKLRCLTRG